MKCDIMFFVSSRALFIALSFVNAKLQKYMINFFFLDFNVKIILKICKVIKRKFINIIQDLFNENKNMKML